MSMRRAKYKFYRTAATCAVCETILDRYSYDYTSSLLESSDMEFLWGAVIDAQVRLMQVHNYRQR